jgi:hypothetical protein
MKRNAFWRTVLLVPVCKSVHSNQVAVEGKEILVPNQAKVGKVMREYKKGTLRSSSGSKVTKRKQAVAIAMSEAGMAKKKRRG